MKRLLPCARCLLRFSLAAIFAHQAAIILILPLFRLNTGAIGPHFHNMQPFLIAAHALLFVISIWLFFGIRTRVVALLGAALFITMGFTEHLAVPNPTIGQLLSIAVLALALPLIVYGGGRWTSYSRGWRDVL